MSYDWTQHVSRGTVERRPGGVGAGGRAFLGKDAPAGLRFTSSFYLQWAFDNVMKALSFATDDERGYVEDLCEWMRELDEDMTYLTAYQRRDYAKLVQPSPADEF